MMSKGYPLFHGGLCLLFSYQQRVQRDPVKLHIRKCQTPHPNPMQDPNVVYRVMSVQVLFYYSRDTISSRAIYWWFANVVSIMQKIEPLRIPVNYGWVSLSAC